jgi:hypothetical protein
VGHGKNHLNALVRKRTGEARVFTKYNGTRMTRIERIYTDVETGFINQKSKKDCF